MMRLYDKWIVWARRSLLIVAVVGFCLPNSSAAYTVTTHNQSVPYEVLPVTVTKNQQFIIGELDGYPEMIEWQSDEALPLTLTLYALPETDATQFGVIAVRVLEPRGVAEITRLRPTTEWSPVRDPLSRLALQLGPTWSETVASGTYRVEVSTPENYGKYLLLVGSDPGGTSYRESWQAVATLYEFAGVSKLGMVRSPLVYYPIGIMLLVAGFGYTLWRTRDRILPLINRWRHHG